MPPLLNAVYASVALAFWFVHLNLHDRVYLEVENITLLNRSIMKNQYGPLIIYD
jgi:hypothetical protein